MILAVLLISAYVVWHGVHERLKAWAWAPPFSSTDMRPVRVTLRDWRPNENGRTTFEVPRAWITNSAGQTTRDFDQMPDRIETTSLTLALADPAGTALTVWKNQSSAARRRERDAAEARMRAELYADIRSRGLSAQDVKALIEERTKAFDWARRHEATEAEARLRAEEYHVTLVRTHPSIGGEDWTRRSEGRTIVERDGLEFDTSRGGYHLLQPAHGEIAEASCMGDGKPAWFCDYHVRVGPDLLATITFVDFRFHGGPDYAAARIRRALDALCRQPGIRCSESWVGGR